MLNKIQDIEILEMLHHMLCGRQGQPWSRYKQFLEKRMEELKAKELYLKPLDPLPNQPKFDLRLRPDQIAVLDQCRAWMEASKHSSFVVGSNSTPTGAIYMPNLLVQDGQLTVAPWVGGRNLADVTEDMIVRLQKEKQDAVDHQDYITAVKIRSQIHELLKNKSEYLYNHGAMGKLMDQWRRGRDTYRMIIGPNELTQLLDQALAEWELHTKQETAHVQPQ